MKNWLPIVLFCFMLFLAHCGGGAEGGSEFGNPSRLVVGTLSSDANSNLNRSLSKLESFFIRSAHAAHTCPADTVIATDSLARTTSASVEEDCSFALTLTTNKAYVFSFVSGSAFVATLIVTNSPDTLPSTAFFISLDEDKIDLGVVTIVDNDAVPENEPAEQNDQDEDGTNDFDDEDDDGDGTADDEESDCDLDDYEDDYDEDDPCDTEEEEEDDSVGNVLEVIPNDGDEFVAFDEEIVVRFDCEVNPETVASDTFRVESDEDDIACGFSFSNSNNVVTCIHDDQHFLPSTIYTASIEGIFCADGTTEIAPEAWSWTTEEHEESGEEE